MCSYALKGLFLVADKTQEDDLIGCCSRPNKTHHFARKVPALLLGIFIGISSFVED